MFLSDHETSIDLLYYDAIAKTVVKLIRGSGSQPLTIGIHGDWGAGKSSVLAMAEKHMDEEKDTLCLRFNGWQFQGFEDAKTALIEAIITELRDAKKENEGVLDKASALLRRVDYLKLAQKGISYGLSIASGIPHPEQIKDAASLIMGLAEAVKGNLTLEEMKKGVTDAAGFLKPEKEKKIPEQIRAFHKEFKDLLAAAELKRLVVLVDDLDRCLPKTAIDTLEAIRLFLFAPHTAFVVAADEAMIEYSVKQHFPDLPMTSGPLTYARNYLEKLIQVPFRIPSLGYAETQTYVALILMQAGLGEGNEAFGKLLETARDCLSKPWRGGVFDLKAARKKLLGEGPGDLPAEVTQALTLSGQVSRVLTDGTKGNPRQVKRFLNSLLLRKEIAEARGLAADIKQAHLAKIMLAESFAPLGFYDQITRVAYEDANGKSGELVALEAEVRVEVGRERAGKDGASDKVETAKNAGEWSKSEWVRTWARLDPPLGGEDLRPYLFVTRDKRSYFGGVANGGHLDSIADALLGKELAVKGVEAQLAKLTPAEAEQVFDTVHAKIMEAESFGEKPHGLMAMAKTHSALQRKLLNLLKEVPVGKLGAWATSGFDRVFTDVAVQREYQILRQGWESQEENTPLRAGAIAAGKRKK